MTLQKCCPTEVINIPATAECSSGRFHPVLTGPLSPSDWPAAEYSESTHYETNGWQIRHD